VTENGFDSFFQERFSKMIVLLIAMGASRADAEDAVQEAMILAWRQWDTLHEPAAWVRTVAVRTYWKSARANQSLTALEDSMLDAVSDADLSIFTEEQQQVLRMLRALPQQQRTVAALFYDGLACDEIAKVLGKPPSTVRSHLRHARSTLKEIVTRAL
jgi:RNA polymerase sigma-70 factor (ECF subfamily)